MLETELLGILARAHPNLVLVGPEPATARAVARIQHCLRLPIETWSPPDPPALPNKHHGTLLVPAIDAADAAQQSQLCAWLDLKLGIVQVVALSVTPLFSRVERGLFLPHLYYRLNQLYVDLTGAE